jgi:peptidyl-dipeptidase Dcp
MGLFELVCGSRSWKFPIADRLDYHSRSASVTRRAVGEAANVSRDLEEIDSMRRAHLLLAVCLFVTLAACSGAPSGAPDQNPFFVEWKTPYGVPPFDQIEVEHFLPAFEKAMEEQRSEVEAIANSDQSPSFANTIEALDATGQLMARVAGVFYTLTGAETNDEIQAIAKNLAPKRSNLLDDILMNERLFERVEAVYQQLDELELDAEQRRLRVETYRDFVRGGAQLDASNKERLRQINSRLASLTLQFGDNVLAETNAFQLWRQHAEDLSGLPDNVVAAAADAAAETGEDGKWLFTLHSPSIWPFLQYADNRELRREILTAYISRGDNGNEYDNKEILTEIAALRAERAQLLGYESHADFVLERQMAKEPGAVYRLLNELWQPARGVAAREARDLQARILADGHDFELEPWDWRYYTEKIRQDRYDLNDQELRSYFELDNVIEGAFYVAERLYGIEFTERDDIPTYHPEVRTYEVSDADGSHLGVFMADYHPRPGKRGGAWSRTIRGQWVKDGKDVRPIVLNVGNFSRPAGDTPALLRLEEVETLFHELGHGLHSLFAQVNYNQSRRVARDFVELPSQIMENWLLEPEVLTVYARHYRTGHVIPDELIDKALAAGTFNQGFATTEQLAASFLDMDWHTLVHPLDVDPVDFENQALAAINLMPEIVTRYRSPYFRHIFSGGYSAGYYSYIWAEVLESDAFQAFKENGIFDRQTAHRFRTEILERVGSEEFDVLWLNFRGREPSVEPLLRKRGLSG